MNGMGVTETLGALAGLVWVRVDARFALDAMHGLTREEFVRQLIPLRDDEAEGEP